MKFLRKLLNIPNSDEKKIIAEQCEKIKNIAWGNSSAFDKEQRDKQKGRDGTCPHCGGHNIVNKIARVEGSGSVSGSFIFGGGSVYGSSSTDTNEVNHCNGCGNQWKKYEREYKGSSGILAGWINDVSTHLEGEYAYAGAKTVEMLKDFYAETIWAVFNEVEDDCYYSTRDDLSLSLLRKKFKSVYDR